MRDLWLHSWLASAGQPLAGAQAREELRFLPQFHEGFTINQHMVCKSLKNKYALKTLDNDLCSDHNRDGYC
jgi:hypothetical protein